MDDLNNNTQSKLKLKQNLKLYELGILRNSIDTYLTKIRNNTYELPVPPKGTNA